MSNVMTETNEDSDVPPLEDMSELLGQARQLWQMKEKRVPPTVPGSRRDTNLPSSTPKAETTATETSIDNSKNIDSQGERKKGGTSAENSISRKDDSFGGMKKGFLMGAQQKSPKSKARDQRTAQKDSSNRDVTVGSKCSDDIPLVKPKGGVARSGAQAIPEVQEALKASAPLLQNQEWITDDLLSKIEQHPRLARQMADPSFSQAMALLKSDPRGAMQHFQGNTDIQEFFQDFYGILGDHFSNLGLTEQLPSSSTQPAGPVQEVKGHGGSGVDMAVAGSSDPDRPAAEEEARLKRITSDPEVVRALGNPRVRVLFECLRTDPDRAQRMMQTADVEMKRCIQKLVDVGLLGFAR